MYWYILERVLVELSVSHGLIQVETGPPKKVRGGAGGHAPPSPTFSLFWNRTLPGIFSWKFAFCKASKSFLAPALPETLGGPEKPHPLKTINF